MSEICKKNCGKLIKLAKGPLRGSAHSYGLLKEYIKGEVSKIIDLCGQTDKKNHKQLWSNRHKNY